MKQLIAIVTAFAALFLASCSSEVPSVYEVGPYTVTTILEGMVYDIEDSNHDNPAGMHVNADGKPVMNNCSNMFIVLGKKQALLIDLSNDLKWGEDPAGSLRKVFSDLAGKRQKLIAITHAHGDHTGMVHAFADDPSISFFLPRNDFSDDKKFPKERVTLFDEGYKFDLGGVVINTIYVPGHTPGSVVYSVEGQDIIFTGDAVGSGSGVWIFSYDGYLQFEKGLANLIGYIENPANGIDKEKLVLYGAHEWQKGNVPELKMQYLYDMQAVVDDITAGKATWEPYAAALPMLNANFKHGGATITWSKESYQRLCAERGISVEIE